MSSPHATRTDGAIAHAGTERQRMLAGQPYRSADPQLVAERQRAAQLCARYNALAPDADRTVRQALLAALLHGETDAAITAPFFCDYGYNIRLGANVYFNFNCVLLDVMPITIGANTLVGPGVHIYTATHPLDAVQRRAGVESGIAVTIGDDVWIGGGSIVCPGVSIGAATVIGAGSVVTRDIPAGVVAAGNPCRVLRQCPA